ncbi:MAG: tRNA (guanosine(37)-N1)-methyltransferase TrmD, partial [Clostridia bacterium]|nr:tRNA (guanosine(37)-N1)-methyltransferase TrmD [Clostridia bacterium]
VPGVITAESLLEESFTGENLEYPQYTRPRVFRGLEVPEVLLSGNHAEIKKWRESHSKKI